jgi:hypothetical protein
LALKEFGVGGAQSGPVNESLTPIKLGLNQMKS